MPLFEFRCTGCDRAFEQLVRGSATPVCPACGGTSLERIISTFAVSSDATQQRSRQRLGAVQKIQSSRNQAERNFYKHDHHDD